MDDSTSSHGGTEVTDRDDRQLQSNDDTTLHDSWPWLRLDYSAADHVDDLDETTPDSSVPGAHPDSETSVTGFSPSDVSDERQEYWEWLERLNSGVGAGDRRKQKREGGIERDLGVVCAQLGCTDRQQERAAWLLERIDLKGEIITNGRLETAILGVVSLVVDEDRSRYRSTENSDAPLQSVTRDDTFIELCAEFGVDPSDVRDARRRVRDTDVYESPNSP